MRQYRLNKDTFIERSSKIHNNKYDYSKVVYKNQRSKVVITCPIHGDFEQTPKNHMKGQGCPLCGKDYARKLRKGDYNGFLSQINHKFGNRFSFPKIEEEFENNRSKVTVVCNWCGNTFTKIARDMLSSPTGGCWCKEKEEQSKRRLERKIERSATRKAQRKESMVGLAKERLLAFPTIAANLDGYENTMTPFPCECKVCGCKFMRNINNFVSIKGNPCPECARKERSKERTKTTEEFVEDMNRVHGPGTYELIGEYFKSSDKVTVLCKECGKTFTIEANSLLQGNGCPRHYRNSSIMEKSLTDFINTIYDGEILTNDRTLLDGHEIDVYLPNLGIAFEFDGLFWHNEEHKGKTYHIKKTEDCAKKNVRLIHIFEDEWLEKRPIWESMIKNLIIGSDVSIYARNCNVRHVDGKEFKEFLTSNHLQGWCPSTIKLGLYHNDELMSVMSFGKSRHFIGNGEVEYELLRFCNKLNTTVLGGASKLFSQFIREYQPSSVVSYADRRWSVGNLYIRMGFSESHCSKPNYYYVIGNKRRNRFNFRKKILVEKYGCPDDMSERDFCRQQKWHRIYDCGTIVYKWSINKKQAK